MKNQPSDELSAREAAALLGVKLPTLYAYVSRGLLRSLPAREGRARRYLRADLEALRERGPSLRAAAGALRWGEPILESAITAMTLEGPAYRGELAAKLVEDGVGFEAVAELLWTGRRGEASHWEPEPAPELDGVGPLLPSDGPHASVFPVLVAVRAAGDAGRFDTTPEGVLPRARSLVRLLAAGLALPRAPARARRAVRAPRIAEVVARAFALDTRPETLAAIDAVLILLADHELNASTFAARIAASTHADVYAVVQAGLATLSGPLHGSASDRFEALLAEVGTPEQAERVVFERARRGERIPGFGHPFYGRAGDARARVLLEIAWGLGRETPELATANAVIGAMERADKPPPNVDSAAVALRAALGMPRGAVAGLFAVARTVGWDAHALEQIATGHLLRPRARYTGPQPPDAATA
ncbi:MAG: citrate synthase family protein [Myxococcota bacterium]